MLLNSARYDLAGKVALVTGAGQGIGRALAEELARRGAQVVVLDVDADAAKQVADQLADGDAVAIAADVRDRTAMADAVIRTVEHFGHLDVVVANAGVAPQSATLRTMDPADFDRVIDINLTGVFNTVHPALDAVIDRRGHIVVVSSVAAFAPGAGGAPYMISKAGVEQLGRALRIELAAHGATAGVAYFGVVDTAMTHHTLDDDPLGRTLGQLLPPPLRQRISPAAAATVIADGITRRAARTIAPRAWEPYSMLRGLANVVVDNRLAGDRRIHQLLGQLEQRNGGR